MNGFPIGFFFLGCVTMMRFMNDTISNMNVTRCFLSIYTKGNMSLQQRGGISFIYVLKDFHGTKVNEKTKKKIENLH